MNGHSSPSFLDRLKAAWLSLSGQRDPLIDLILLGGAVDSAAHPVPVPVPDSVEPKAPSPFGSSIAQAEHPDFKLAKQMLALRSKLIGNDWRYDQEIFALSDRLLSQPSLKNKSFDHSQLLEACGDRVVQVDRDEFCGIMFRIAENSWTGIGSNEAIQTSEECLKWLSALRPSMRPDWSSRLIRLIERSHWKSPCARWSLAVHEELGPLREAPDEQWMELIQLLAWVVPKIVSSFSECGKRDLFQERIDICSQFVFPELPLSQDNIERVSNGLLSKSDRSTRQVVERLFSELGEHGQWSWRSVALSMLDTTLVSARNSFIVSNEDAEIAKEALDLFKSNLERLSIGCSITERSTCVSASSPLRL